MFSRFLRFFTPLQWVEILLIVIVGVVVFNVGGSMIESIQNKFGLETKSSLKEKTIEQSKIINDVSDINKNLIRSLGIIDSSNTITKEAIVTTLKSEVKINSNFQAIKNKKDENIVKIKDDFSNRSVTTESTVEMEKKVSTEQITSLWNMYCSETNDSAQCKEINHV